MSDMSDIIKASLDGIRTFTDMNTIVGNAINTPSGTTVIPISKVTVGFAGGGIDYIAKKLSHSQNFGGGSGTGISINPVAFLTVSQNSEINLIQINEKSDNIEKIISFIERTPDIIDRIRTSLS